MSLLLSQLLALTAHKGRHNLSCLLIQIRNFLRRPGARAASANFSWLIVEKLMRLVLGLGVGVWMARYLGPEQFGVLGYCLALVTLLGFLPSLGLDAVVKRDLLQCPKEADELMSCTLALRLIAGVVGYAFVFLTATGGWGLNGDEPSLLLILGLLVFQPALWAPDLWLQAHLRARLSVTAQLVALVVCSVLRVWLILTEGTLVAFAIVVVVEMTTAAAGFWLAIRNLGLTVSLSEARRAKMATLLGEAWPLMFASLAVVVYMRIDEVMLRHLLGAEAVGIYSAATRLSEVWHFVPMMIGSSVLPALLRARAQDVTAYGIRMQQYFDLSAGFAYVLSVPIALTAPHLVRFAYGEAYAGAGPILSVHIWSSMFVFLGVARGQWLVNEHLQRFYLMTTVAGAFINILLNLFAIPKWGGLGAAWSTLVAYAIAAWLASYFHPAVRETAAMQSRALLIPFRAWRYLRQP